MTKSEIFKKAHSIAKSIVSIVGNYSIAFSTALKEVYANASARMFSDDLLDEIFFVNMDQACFGDFAINTTVDGDVENFAFTAVGFDSVVVLHNGDVYKYEHKGRATGNLTWNGDDVLRKEIQITYELKNKIGKIEMSNGDIEDVAFDILKQVSNFLN